MVRRLALRESNREKWRGLAIACEGFVSVLDGTRASNALMRRHFLMHPCGGEKARRSCAGNARCSVSNSPFRTYLPHFRASPSSLTVRNRLISVQRSVGGRTGGWSLGDACIWISPGAHRLANLRQDVSFHGLAGGKPSWRLSDRKTVTRAEGRAGTAKNHAAQTRCTAWFCPRKSQGETNDCSL